jgi:hypothetical protein
MRRLTAGPAVCWEEEEIDQVPARNLTTEVKGIWPPESWPASDLERCPVPAEEEHPREVAGK